MNQKDTDQNNEHKGNEDFSAVAGWTQGHTQPVTQVLVRQTVGAEGWPVLHMPLLLL